jgi:hypothetical protein
MNGDDEGRAPGAGPGPEPEPEADRPFPESLCHLCEAPRYIRSGKGSVFILCPRWPGKYPPQPVVRCPLFSPRVKNT